MFEKIEEVLEKDYDHETPYIPMSKEFNREFRKEVKKRIKPFKLSLIPSSVNCYCESSGFITNGTKYVYFHTSDFRYWPDEWKNHILIRKAKDERDFHGEANYYCSLEEIGEKANELMGGRN